MKRLIAKNKRLLTKRFRQKASVHQPQSPVVTSVTFASISASKLRGQQSHEKRLLRQSRMNTRQLKKYRQKQALSGLGGSKYGGMCAVELKPAGFIVNTNKNIQLKNHRN